MTTGKDNGQLTPEEALRRSSLTETQLAAVLTAPNPDLLIDFEARRFQQVIAEAVQWNANRDYTGVFDRKGNDRYQPSLRTLELLPEKYRNADGEFLEAYTVDFFPIVKMVVDARRDMLSQRTQMSDENKAIKGRLVWSDPTQTLTGGEVPQASYGFLTFMMFLHGTIG